MKKKILHNATEMFLNIGFKSITMDDIASNAGISKKTTYVVAGDNMGPSKKTKAEDLGVAIINEDNFIEMIS